MTRAPALVLVALGVAIVARTVLEGVGGGLGILLGSLFVAAGVARLLALRRA